MKLISGAIQANQEHRLVSAGLGGSFGYPYGPIPIQIYQLLALVSHNPVTLIRLHAGLFAGVTALALLYLANVLNLSPWFAPMTMLGPFFFFYTRLLWDNTFAIPIGTLLLAAYGDQLRRPNRVAFFTFVSCGLALPFIHLMTLPLVIAVACHAIVTQRRAIRQHWAGLIVIFVCLTISCGAYVNRVVRQAGHSSGLIAPAPDHLNRPAAFAFPLLGGRLFCAYGFFDARGPELGLEQSGVVVVARFISLVAYPLFWIGILATVARLRRKIGIPQICIMALLLQSLMDERLQISPYPHYYCGTWAAIAVLLWIGLDWLRSIRLRLPVALLYAASLVVATTAFVIDIHRGNGGAVWYGPSLQAQRAVTEVQTRRP